MKTYEKIKEEQDRKRTNRTRIGEFFPNPGKRHKEILLNNPLENMLLNLENERLHEYILELKAKLIQEHGLQMYHEAIRLTASYRCLQIVK